MNNSTELRLTPQEKRVISLCLHGRSYGEIAFSLDIAVNTANTHLRSVRSKLSVPNCTALATKALFMGFDMQGNYQGQYLFYPEPNRTYRNLPWEKKA